MSCWGEGVKRREWESDSQPKSTHHNITPSRVNFKITLGQSEPYPVDYLLLNFYGFRCHSLSGHLFQYLTSLLGKNTFLSAQWNSHSFTTTFGRIQAGFKQIILIFQGSPIVKLSIIASDYVLCNKGLCVAYATIFKNLNFPLFHRILPLARNFFLNWLSTLNKIKTFHILSLQIPCVFLLFLLQQFPFWTQHTQS